MIENRCTPFPAPAMDALTRYSRYQLLLEITSIYAVGSGVAAVATFFDSSGGAGFRKNWVGRVGARVIIWRIMMFQSLMKLRLPIAVALLVATTVCQTNSPVGSQDIVSKLLPDGAAGSISSLKLSPSEKAHAIKELERAQKEAKSERANQIAFLLAALGSNYRKNRDHLVWAIQGCTPPRHDCDDLTGNFLIELYQNGHKDVLPALLKSGLSTNAVSLSEGLGSFYAGLVTQHPNDFLKGISPFSPQKQKQLCALAGSSDGSGLSPGDLRKTRKSLNAMDNPVAKLCLREIEQANKP